MKIIVGLGNPESKYTNTRHNVGFRFLDNYAQSQATPWQQKDKFKAQIAELIIDDEKVVLVKPQTYYNLSGESVRSVADFYKVNPQDILVIHDELALPFGTIRTRLGGSPAGNNGVKSINEHLGPDTARLRVGIWNELRDKMDDAAFVLATFSKEESEVLSKLDEKIGLLIEAFITNTFEPTTHS